MRKAREWNIERGVFRPFPVYPQNTTCIQIIEAIRETSLQDVYIRGSVLEDFRPHIGSDLDLYVLSDRNIGFDIYDTLRFALTKFERPIEVIISSRSALMEDKVRSLLLSTRSYCITGEAFPDLCIPADIHIARALWRIYNPTKYTDGYIPIRSLIIAKQLFRAVGVVRLVEDMRLSRHLPTCLQWAWEIAPVHVARCYQKIWDNLQTPHWTSVPVEPVVRWLKNKEHHHGLLETK